MNRKLTAFGILGVLVVGAAVLCLTSLNPNHSRLEQALQEADNIGFGPHSTDAKPKRIPAELNAAIPLVQLRVLLGVDKGTRVAKLAVVDKPEVITLALAASQRPGLSFARDESSEKLGGFAEFSSLRTAAQILYRQAQLAIGVGDEARAAHFLDRAAHLSSLYQQDPSLMSVLMQIAVEQQGMAVLQEFLNKFGRSKDGTKQAKSVIAEFGKTPSLLDAYWKEGRLAI